MKRILDTIIEITDTGLVKGTVASYIPELAKADPNILGICVTTLDGREYHSGDYDTKFTLQSYIKGNYINACHS